MNIEVKVATILLDKANPKLHTNRFDMTLPDGTDVAGLLDALGLQDRLVGSVTINKRRSRMDAAIADGDVVAVVPAISGG
jgi:sulfur carrier protein ThiS